MRWLIGLAVCLLANKAEAKAMRATVDCPQTTVNNDAHVPFGQRQTLIRIDNLIPCEEGENGEELDITEWIIPSDMYTLHARPETKPPRTRILGALRTRLRDQEPTGQMQQEHVSGEERDTVDPIVLESLTQPVVPSEIWSELTGREFETRQTVEKFAQTGLHIARTPSNDWVEWKPVDKTTAAADEKGTHMVELESDQILAYSGKWRKQGHGSHLPIIKTQAIIDMPPKEIAELLLDSARVKTYNKMSLGRTDVRVMQLGLDTHGSFGHGETKIVRNLTQPPITKKQMLAVTMMHGRKLRPEDGIESGGYLVVSRAVPDRSQDADLYSKTEVLLGVNVLQQLKDQNQCLLTAVTHVYSPALPTIVASRVGVSSAINFVNDIRKVCRPRIKA